MLAKLEHKKHYFLVGPQVSVLYEGNLRHEEAKQNVTARLNPVDISVVLGGGTGTAIVTATTDNRSALIILGMFVSMALFFAAIGLYLAIRKEIRRL